MTSGPEAAAEMFEPRIEFSDAFRFVVHPAGFEIGDQLQAKVACAAHALSRQNRKLFVLIRAPALAVSQLLNRRQALALSLIHI